ncbi:MBL fold metallo-hydrolase [Desulfothermus okinawensis JCM 13304]
MKLTIIYDNTTISPALRADWGFSALVESRGRKILFDTGADGKILLSNMERLAIDPKEITDVFISHLHWDHTGGLLDLIEINNQVNVWLPSPFWKIKGAKNIFHLKRPTKLYDGIYSTGEIDKVEQSLCVKTNKGIIIIVGCSHPRMEHIIAVASQFGEPYGIIGGLHGTRPQSLQGLSFICATHCTQHKSEIMSIYPEHYIKGGAGKIIEIE